MGILKFTGRRRKIFLVLPALWFVMVAFRGCHWAADVVSDTLTPPPPPDQNLDHFRRNRDLKSYLDDIQLLVEPSSVPCDKGKQIPLIILVTSSPLRFYQRQAIRDTWGPHYPTYFILGLNKYNVDEEMVDNYVEAKEHSDMIIYEFQDHYQNLTLKTALMMKWTLARCPGAEFMFKTDDDVLVNPWKMNKVLKDNKEAELIGYKVENSYLHRDEYNKWYLPRWLYNEDEIPEYLSGTGYLVRGTSLKKILEAAYEVPLVNLEDVYFTYIVAMKTLGISLTHDRRLSPVTPWISSACVFWDLASVHSLDFTEMISAWSQISEKAVDFENGKSVCHFYNTVFSSTFLAHTVLIEV